jgi:hypothetical protein
MEKLLTRKGKERKLNFSDFELVAMSTIFVRNQSTFKWFLIKRENIQAGGFKSAILKYSVQIEKIFNYFYENLDRNFK